MIKDWFKGAICYYCKFVNANATTEHGHSTLVPNHFTCKCGPVATGATSVVEVDLFDSCLSNIAGAKIHSGTRQVQCW